MRHEPEFYSHRRVNNSKADQVGALGCCCGLYTQRQHQLLVCRRDENPILLIVFE